MLITSLKKLKEKNEKSFNITVSALFVGFFWAVLGILLGGSVRGFAWILFWIVAGVLFIGISGIVIWRNFFLWTFWLFIGSLFGIGLLSLFLNYPEFVPLWLLAVELLVLTELLFWLDAEKRPKSEKKFNFTVLKKIESFIEAVFIVGVLNVGRLAIENIDHLYLSHSDANKIINFPLAIGSKALVIIGILLIAVIYIYLSSLKYKRHQ